MVKRKPPGYWTKERVLKEVRRYKTYKELRKKNRSVTEAARLGGYLDEIHKILSSDEGYSTKKPGHWQKKVNCIDAAKQCSTYAEFTRTYAQAYRSVRLNGWIEEFKKMFPPSGRKPDGYYSYEKCKEIASKCNTRKEFETLDVVAYDKCRNKGWIEDVCSHMERKRVVNNSYTKAMCAKEAKKYNSRKEFQSKSPKVYDAAVRYKWIKEICSHMKLVGSRYSRALYVFEFEDKSAYVGLTYDYEERFNYHYNQGYVSEKLEECGADFIMLNEFYTPERAAKEEKKLIKKYKDKGWKILNRAPAGSIGAKEKVWDKETVAKEAKKYKTRKEFFTSNNSAYTLASKNGWLKEVCSHMEYPNGRKHGFGYWTKERCYQAAKKCRTKKEFREKYPTACTKCASNGWDDAVEHLKGRKRGKKS